MQHCQNTISYNRPYITCQQLLSLTDNISVFVALKNKKTVLLCDLFMIWPTFSHVFSVNQWTMSKHRIGLIFTKHFNRNNSNNNKEFKQRTTLNMLTCQTAITNCMTPYHAKDNDEPSVTTSHLTKLQQERMQNKHRIYKTCSSACHTQVKKITAE